MLSNAYFLAKFRFDTAENEPAKNLQNLADPAAHCSDCSLRAADARVARPLAARGHEAERAGPRPARERVPHLPVPAAYSSPIGP